MFKSKSTKSFVYKETDYPELAPSASLTSETAMDFKKASTISAPEEVKKDDVILPGWIYIAMNKSNQISYTCIPQKYHAHCKDEYIISNMILRWEKDAAAYIDLYGQEEYERQFKMPTNSYEIDEEEDEEEEEYNEDSYYSDEMDEQW